MSSGRLVLHRILTVLILWGIGASVLEGAGCDERFETQGSSVAAAEWAHPGAPAGSALPCCPCIHTYPSSFTIAAGFSVVVVGYLAEYSFVASSGPDRSPEPLVPPPIA